MTYPLILHALARLSVDIAFRRAFREDPRAALGRLDLSEEERRAFTRLDPATAILMGRVYDVHRRIRIVEHVPWVDTSLRPALDAYLSHYAEATRPVLTNRDEALAFCRWLEGAEPPREAPYLSELARFERFRIGVAWGLERVPAEPLRFEYPILDIRAELDAPGFPQVRPRETFLSFDKVPSIPAVVIRPRDGGQYGSPEARGPLLPTPPTPRPVRR